MLRNEDGGLRFFRGEEKELLREDWDIFDALTSVELSEEEKRKAVSPTETDPLEENVFAVHFHPEWVPLDLIETRLAKAFPNARNVFAIPTQHNAVLSMEPHSGVELDVYSPLSGMKVQLLVHFRTPKPGAAHTFERMVKKTFEHRALQLLDVLDKIENPDGKALAEIKKAGTAEESIALGKIHATKLRLMIEESGITGTPRAEMLKNRLLTDYIELRNPDACPERMDALLSHVNRVKNLAKAKLDPRRFHDVREVIEEARGLGAGIVVPHPPRFWPVLLEDLDVDGWEVWNPSTPDHAVFLAECLARRHNPKRPPLAFMGDDTHMSSKIRPDMVGDKGGTKREIGFQPPWKDPAVKKALEGAGQSRERTMAEYLSRLG